MDCSHRPCVCKQNFKCWDSACKHLVPTAHGCEQKPQNSLNKYSLHTHSHTHTLTVSVTTNCRISWNNESANGKHKSDTTLHVKVCPQHFTWMGTEMIDDKKGKKKSSSVFTEKKLMWTTSQANKTRGSERKKGGRREDRASSRRRAKDRMTQEGNEWINFQRGRNKYDDGG